MDYSETNSDFGDRRNNREDTRRPNKLDSLLKGFHSSGDTFTGNIHKLVWAKSSHMRHLGTHHENCRGMITHNGGGNCWCPQNSFLRGQENGSSPWLDSWLGSFCNKLSGFFTKNCEEKDWEGKDKATMCPKKKFWTGVRGDHGADLSRTKIRCCEAEYNEPVSPPLRMRNGPHGNFYFRNQHGNLLEIHDRKAGFRPDASNPQRHEHKFWWNPTDKKEEQVGTLRVGGDYLGCAKDNDNM